MQDQAALEVVILDLRVILAQEGDFWIAQAIDFDYAAYGSTEDEARANFEEGLELTIQDNLDEFGTLEHMIQPAPAELWRDLIGKRNAQGNWYWQRSVHPISLPIPYGAIGYYTQAEAA